MRATIYTRLSRDRDDQESTARQEAACRDYAASRGWTVHSVLTDIDRSAYRRGVIREGFEELVTQAKNRDTDVVLFWKLDRLVRAHRDFERLWAACEANDVQLAAVVDPVDTTSEVGLMIVRMLVSFAHMESVSTSVRVTAARKASASRGDPPQTTRRPFGLTQDWSQIIEPEAEAIRDAVAMLTGGQSAYDVAREWNRRGLISPMGKPWRSSTVVQCLKAPRLAARRTYRGEVVAEGKWPAILDPFTFDRLQVVLSDPRRGKGGGGPARHLLTGVLRCHCGTSMSVRPKANGTRRYLCRRDIGGCGAGIIADPAEGHVVDVLLHFIETGEFAKALAESDSTGTIDAVHQDEAKLEQLALDYADGLIGRGEWLTMRDRISTRLEANRRRASDAYDEILGLTRDHWDAQSVQWQRGVLRLAFEKVVCGPSTGSRFDEDRLQPVWRV